MKSLLSLLLVAALAAGSITANAQDDKKCNKACCTKTEKCKEPCKEKCTHQACADLKKAEAKKNAAASKNPC